jgi:predicted RNA binding protein YcfA (HicA-like mRNA interferase family)
MKLPRDIDGPKLAKALHVLGYQITRQKGSHIRVTTLENGENHEVVPCHSPIKPGTLSCILKHVAAHHRLTLDDLIHLLDL